MANCSPKQESRKEKKTRKEKKIRESPTQRRSPKKLRQLKKGRRQVKHRPGVHPRKETSVSTSTISLRKKSLKIFRENEEPKEGHQLNLSRQAPDLDNDWHRLGGLMH
jgi:hypothetical protein